MASKTVAPAKVAGTVGSTADMGVVPMGLGIPPEVAADISSPEKATEVLTEAMGAEILSEAASNEEEEDEDAEEGETPDEMRENLKAAQTLA